MQDPNNLAVYHRALAFAVECNRVVRRIRAREAPGLAAQLHRAAVSIAANISEGASSSSAATFARHLAVALGSVAEVETHLVIAGRTCGRVGNVDTLIDESRQIRAMLFALRRYQLGKAEQKSRTPPLPSS